MSRSSGLLDLPDVGQLLPILAIAGGAYVLLIPGPDGTSLFQKLGGAVAGANQAAAGAGGVATSIGRALGGGGYPNNAGAANAGADSFNINTDPSASWARAVGGGAIGAVLGGAHVGIGHVGGGGSFSVRLWASTGGLFGLGASQPIKLGEQAFGASADQSWTGYGVDFPTTPISGPGGGWFGPGSISVWADVIDPNGTLYTQAQLPVVTF